MREVTSHDVDGANETVLADLEWEESQDVAVVEGREGRGAVSGELTIGVVVAGDRVERELPRSGAPANPRESTRAGRPPASSAPPRWRDSSPGSHQRR